MNSLKSKFHYYLQNNYFVPHNAEDAEFDSITGDYYRCNTKKFANKMGDYWDSLRELIAIARFLNEGWEPDWNDIGQDKFYIQFDEVNGWCCLRLGQQHFAEIVFKNRENANSAIELLSEKAKEILKYGIS